MPSVACQMFLDHFTIEIAIMILRSVIFLFCFSYNQNKLYEPLAIVTVLMEVDADTDHQTRQFNSGTPSPSCPRYRSGCSKKKWTERKQKEAPLYRILFINIR